MFHFRPLSHFLLDEKILPTPVHYVHAFEPRSHLIFQSTPTIKLQLCLYLEIKHFDKKNRDVEDSYIYGLQSLKLLFFIILK